MILFFNVDVTVVFVGHDCLKGFRESLLHLKKGSALLLKEKKIIFILFTGRLLGFLSACDYADTGVFSHQDQGPCKPLILPC